MFILCAVDRGFDQRSDQTKTIQFILAHGVKE
jgi:hypothetical protein